jgi:hypothetical protein
MSVSDTLYFYSSLENDTESDTGDDSKSHEGCMITQTPLSSDHVTLECGHKFNYDAIFNDIYYHKKRFHDMESSRLKGTQLRCPYCRNIQNCLLPCPPGKNMVCGVNAVVDIPQEQVAHMRTPSMYWLNYRQFARGFCCHGVNNIAGLSESSSEVICSDTMVIYNDVDERVYCKSHLKENLTYIFNNNIAAAKKDVAHEKREIASIVRQEKLLAKKKAALAEKQDITQKTMRELQSWYSSKMFISQTSINANPVPENVVVSQSINISNAAHAPTNGVTTPVGYEKPVNRCLAITVRHKTRCALKAVKGCIYCSRHKTTG